VQPSFDVTDGFIAWLTIHCSTSYKTTSQLVDALFEEWSLYMRFLALLGYSVSFYDQQIAREKGLSTLLMASFPYTGGGINPQRIEAVTMLSEKTRGRSFGQHP